MKIDLNCDLGETVGGVPTADDAAMFQLITSANIACGFHAGDVISMRDSVELAVENNVAIGAHVSYRDRANFGRTNVEISRDALIADVLDQLNQLAVATDAVGARIRYVKPHGALYNRIAIDEAKADAVATAVEIFSPGLPLVGLPGSMVAGAAAAHGLRFVREGFVDRTYQHNGALVSRKSPGAVLHGDDDVASRALRMVVEGAVRAVDGTELRLKIDSLCVHGDTPGSVEMARAVRKRLEQAGVEVAAFA